MADVFISYSRANKDKVQRIARGIEEAGYSVWWDAELPPHQSYGEVITAKINSCKAAVVVWSKDAAASEWVRAEADAARNHKKLIQTALDDTMPPLPFNQIQVANLANWNGEADHPDWRKVRQSLTALCGPPQPAPVNLLTKPAASPVPMPAAPQAKPQPQPLAQPLAQPGHPMPSAPPPEGAAPGTPDRVPPLPRPAKSGSNAVPIAIGCAVAFFGVIAAIWVVALGLSSASQNQPGTGPQTLYNGASQDMANRDVVLYNQTGETIVNLYWSNSADQNWGPDRLGNQVFLNGANWPVTVDDGSGSCTFDLMARTQSGREVSYTGVEVCSITEVYFN